MTAIGAWQAHLDSRIVLTASYAAATSTFALPCPAYPTIALYLPTGVAYPLAQASTTAVTVAGADLSGGQSVLGVYSPILCELSQIIARDVNDKPELSPAVLMQRLATLHNWATGFGIEISSANPTLWPTSTRAWAPDLTAATYTPYGRMRVGINQIAGHTLVRIVEATWKPVAISGLDIDYEVCDGIR